MKAGLTVLLAVASASVNTHVKVETVNFDEDLLNTEKNIAETSAWKEKKDKKEGPQTEETKTDEKEETKTDEPQGGIEVSFKVDKCESPPSWRYSAYGCKGVLTMKSVGITASATPSSESPPSGDLNDIESVDLRSVKAYLKGSLTPFGATVEIDGKTWLEGTAFFSMIIEKHGTAPETKKIVNYIMDKMKNIFEGKETDASIIWKISKTMLNEKDLKKKTLEIIDSLKKK